MLGNMLCCSMPDCTVRRTMRELEIDRLATFERLLDLDVVMGASSG